jgi:hypothetical protein
MVKIVIAVVLLAHGIGHSLGLLQLAKVATVIPAWRGDSWLLTGAVGSPGTQLIGASLWVLAIGGFAALAAVVLGWLPLSWFTPLAIAAASVSLASIVLFPLAFPTSSVIAAGVGDVLVLVVVGWFRWVPSDLT